MAIKTPGMIVLIISKQQQYGVLENATACELYAMCMHAWRLNPCVVRAPARISRLHVMAWPPCGTHADRRWRD